MEFAPVRLLGIQAERVLPFVGELRIISPQVPVAAFDGAGFLRLTASHTAFYLQAVIDTRCISDHDGRSRISLGFPNRFQTLSIVGAHGYLCGIDVPVSGGHQTQILLADPLSLSSELGDGTEGRSLGRLPARIGIHFRVEHEDVHVFARGDNMIEAAVADIVRSAVATDDPLAPLNQVVIQRLQFGTDRTTRFGTAGNIRFQ